MRVSASASWLRHEFSTHTNRTRRTGRAASAIGLLRSFGHAGRRSLNRLGTLYEPRRGDDVSEGSWEVAVVGAGAAGLIAALRAAERGRRTLLLEKNRKPGVKILMSGGTRCNITHATDNRGIVAAYGPPGKFLHSALASLSVEATIELFEAEGVATKVEETGKVFPVSNKATDVLTALLRRLERSRAVLALDEPVLDVQRAGNGFAL